MKINCHCGAILHDQTDALPHIGHLVPDQEWSPTLEALDEQVVDALADGRIGREGAYHRAREILTGASRRAYQCRACGRLYVDGARGRLHCYVPCGPDASREVLRSRAAKEDL